jgi:hypothetical protein
MFRVAYRKMKKESSLRINADTPLYRVYQMYVHDNEKDDYAICNPWEKDALLWRKAATEWMEDNKYIQDIMKELKTSFERQKQIRQKVFENEKIVVSQEDEMDFENRFVNLLLGIVPVKTREVEGTHIEDF